MATEIKRCGSCLGTGYRGRWRYNSRGRLWKIETCWACRGRGERQVERRPYTGPERRRTPRVTLAVGVEALLRAE